MLIQKKYHNASGLAASSSPMVALFFFSSTVGPLLAASPPGTVAVPSCASCCPTKPVLRLKFMERRLPSRRNSHPGDGAHALALREGCQAGLFCLRFWRPISAVRLLGFT